jgi:hypothetical protein
MGIQWLEYKQKKILHVIYDAVTIDEELALFNSGQKILAESTEPLLMLVDFTAGFISRELMQKMGAVDRSNLKKIALLGLNSFHSFFLNPVLAVVSAGTIKAFDKAEQAKEFLVS